MIAYTDVWSRIIIVFVYCCINSVNFLSVLLLTYNIDPYRNNQSSKRDIETMKDL